MRCVSCNKMLNDFESTRKSEITGEYYDLCNSCFSHIKDDVLALEREDLISCQEIDEDDYMLEEDA